MSASTGRALPPGTSRPDLHWLTGEWRTNPMGDGHMWQVIRVPGRDVIATTPHRSVAQWLTQIHEDLPVLTATLAEQREETAYLRGLLGRYLTAYQEARAAAEGGERR